MIAIVGLTRTQRQLCDSAWPGLDWLYLYTLCHPHGTRAPSRLWQVTHTKNITNTPWNPFVLLFSYMVYMAYIVSAEHFAAFHIIFYVIWGFLFNLIPRLSACPPVRPFRLYGTVNVLFVTYVRLLFAVSVCSACSVPRFPFCFVPLRRLLTNFVCLLLCSLSLSCSNYVYLPLTLTFLAIFTRAFNIHHLFIVGVERLPGAPFFSGYSPHCSIIIIALSLCVCIPCGCWECSSRVNIIEATCDALNWLYELTVNRQRTFNQRDI